LAASDFEGATDQLVHILDTDPGFNEARELLEIVRAAGSEKTPPVTSIADRLRAGAEAYTKGWKSSATQNWARGLSAEPSNRVFQLLVLLGSTPSEERRRSYVKEILSESQKLLADNRSEEAHALLLVAQSVEAPTESLPAESAVSAEVDARQVPTASPPTELSRPDDPITRAWAKPTDTHPTVIDGGPGLSENTRKSEPPVSPDTADHSVQPAGEQTSPLGESALTPDREAALVEARKAELEAGVKESDASGRRTALPLSRARLKLPVLERLGVPPWIAMGGAALLLIAAIGLTAFFSRGRADLENDLESAAGLVADGHYNQAIAAYNRILAQDSNQAFAYLGRGRARLAAGETELGLADLSQAVELAPDAPTMAEELADALFNRSRFKEAEDYYTRAIALGGNNPDAFYRLAASLVGLGRADDALPHLEAALSRDPSHAPARYLRGKLLNAAGRYEDAETDLREARSGFDPGVEYFVELGLALLEQDKLDEAEEVARSFMGYEPTDARAHSLLGEVYLGRKQFEVARDELIAGLQGNANQPRAQLALSRAWLAIGQSRNDPGDFAKARQILESAPGADEGERLMILGQLSLAEGDTFNAINFLEKSLAHGAERLPVRLTLAAARYQAKDLPGAAEELQSAAQLSPTDPAIALSLGLVHSGLKNFQQASEHYLKAIHGVGLQKPPEERSGPVVLPPPYVVVSPKFNVNRAIRDAYRRAIAANQENATAIALKALAESTSFVLADRS
jgi:tetratricopeptide (TPR) repeat protein